MQPLECRLAVLVLNGEMVMRAHGNAPPIMRLQPGPAIRPLANVRRLYRAPAVRPMRETVERAYPCSVPGVVAVIVLAGGAGDGTGNAGRVAGHGLSVDTGEAHISRPMLCRRLLSLRIFGLGDKLKLRHL
ncbi:MAG: hypothetical protein Q7S17_05175 [Xanthobacteraceae bacterium]|nr:hypothetical protein [Xanthobacteraceae bacterium]